MIENFIMCYYIIWQILKFDYILFWKSTLNPPFCWDQDYPNYFGSKGSHQLKTHTEGLIQIKTKLGSGDLFLLNNPFSRFDPIQSLLNIWARLSEWEQIPAAGSTCAGNQVSTYFWPYSVLQLETFSHCVLPLKCLRPSHLWNCADCRILVFSAHIKHFVK